MLGITTPDAIALGTLIIALLAAWKGGKSGDQAKRTDPVHPTSTSTYADIELLANALSLNTGAVVKLTAVLEIEAKRHAVDDEVEQKLALKLIADQFKHPKPRG